MYKLAATDLTEKFKKGEISATEIATYFLKRIEAFDPKIKAFLKVLPERALQKAAELDAKRAQKKPLGKLAAIPTAIKDNMHIKGETTTCASKILENYRPSFDSTVVRLMEEEDAIILGKTNLDEFAMGSSCENSAFFATHNPWDTGRVTGGSSGGSVAAVAARQVFLATGSDTGGSTRQPAAFSGVVGYKPTYGRVSRYGLVAFGSSLDQIGPITTNVKDAALMMEVIGKNCLRDATSLDLPPESYLRDMPASLKDKRIGVPWEFLKSMPEESYKNFTEATEILKSCGAKIVDVDLNILKYSIATYYILATAEASTNLARFDGIRYGLRSKEAKTLDDVYDLTREEGFGAEVKRRIMLGTFVLASGYQDAYYKKAQKVRSLVIRAYEKAFQSADLIAMPVAPNVAFSLNGIQNPIDMYFQDLFTISANLAGVPAISVPSGFDKAGLPFGLQLLAPQLQDKQLILASHAFEQAIGLNNMPPLFDKEAQ